jgi:hypothetical protein
MIPNVRASTSTDRNLKFDQSGVRVARAQGIAPPAQPLLQSAVEGVSWETPEREGA